jgi:hypothetical protein
MLKILQSFFKPKQSLLTDNDIIELKKIERDSYMEEAKRLIVERGINKAKNDYGVKVKEEGWK